MRMQIEITREYRMIKRDMIHRRIKIAYDFCADDWRIWSLSKNKIICSVACGDGVIRPCIHSAGAVSQNDRTSVSCKDDVSTVANGDLVCNPAIDVIVAVSRGDSVVASAKDSIVAISDCDNIILAT